MTIRSREPWKLFLISPMDSGTRMESKKLVLFNSFRSGVEGIFAAWEAGAALLPAQEVLVTVKISAVRKATPRSQGLVLGFCHSSIFFFLIQLFQLYFAQFEGLSSHLFQILKKG